MVPNMPRHTRNHRHSWGPLIHELCQAQTQWEIETGRTILTRRKRWLLVAVLPVLFMLALQIPVLADLTKSLPVLGGSKAYLPSFVTPTMFCGSILVGLIAGLITGVIGAGGGYVLTPALMSFGVKGIMAVGTDQFHLFAKAIMGTVIHRKMGNVNFGLAAWFVAGSLLGVTAGGAINRAIFQHSPALSDAVISSVYVVVLGLLGAYAVGDWLRLRRPGRPVSSVRATTGFAEWLQGLPLAPRVRFDEEITPGGRSLSVYPVVVCGLVVGLVAAIMGVGGGFLTFPMFVYGLGVSTFTTVGTDILQIIFTTFYSSVFQYALYGFVFYSVSVGMLLGSLVGVQIGAMVTRMVKGAQIRVFYALTIIAGFANRACALPRKLADLGYISLPRATTVVMEGVGTVLFFAIVGFFSVWILYVFARNAGSVRTVGAKPRESTPLPVPKRIADPQKFWLGTGGLACFAVCLLAATRPVVAGRSGLQFADDLFNRLAKNSTYAIPEAREQAARLIGVQVDLGVTPREEVDLGEVVQLLSAAGVEAIALPDGRVRLSGDLGRLSEAAFADAEQAFRNQGAVLESRYHMRSAEAAYAWWVVYDGLTRRYTQENRAGEANFCKFMLTRVLEPAYNFRGIEASSIRQHAGPVVLLLVAYVLYTVWYGYAILYVFEGLGIRAGRTTDKREA